MSNIATFHVLSQISNANRAVDVFWRVGDVMAMLIVKMAVMKTQRCVVSYFLKLYLNLFN